MTHSLPASAKLPVLGALLLSVLLAGGCAAVRQNPAPPSPANQAIAATPSVTNLRAKAIRRAVTTWAVQNSVYQWMRAEHRVLRAHAAQLDQIFDFQPLLIAGRITPPVITQAHDTFKLLNPNLATSTITEYRIRAPARIVTVAPNWRDYLLLPVPKPHRLAAILHPRNATERALWKHAEQRGRKWGRAQAKALLAADFARLKRDYIGMARARVLMHQQVLSTPVLARSNQGVRIQGNTLAVGAVILRITSHSRYNRSTRWKAIPAITTNR